MTERPSQLAMVGASEGLWRTLPPIGFDVAGVIPSRALGIISGYSSSLKSWFGFDLALSVASGLPWLMHDPFATTQGAASIVEREAGPYECRRRLHALRRGRGDIDDPPLDVCSFPRGTIFEADFIRRLSDLASERRIIVLDTLAAFAVGVDENTAAMADGLGRLAEVVHTTSCSIVAIAHEKKRGANAVAGDPRERVRGSSSIFGSVDWALSIQRPSPRRPVRVSQTKGRNGREGEPFTVSMVDGVDGAIVWRVEQDSAVKAPLKAVDRVADLHERILDVVGESSECTSADIREGAVGWRTASIVKAIDTMTADGRLVRSGAGKGRVYQLGTR